MRSVALGLALALLVSGNTLAADYKPPRNALGVPDLEGVWDASTLSSLERNPDLTTLVVPDVEAAAYERRWNDPELVEKEFQRLFGGPAYVGDASTEWLWALNLKLARINGQARSFLLIEPANGVLPILPDVRRRLQERRMVEARNFDAPETRPYSERCMAVPGPPLVGREFYRIVQTPDHVVIAVEGHSARIIRFGPMGHAPEQLAPWMGDSIGWWEKDTLVVQTTNFNAGHAIWGNISDIPLSAAARVTERFRRTAPNELLYSFTVDDPANYSSSWSAALPFRATSAPMTDYACHEGNYALGNILRGARRIEQDGGAPEGLDRGAAPATSSAPASATTP